MAELLEAFAAVDFSAHSIAAGREILSEIAGMAPPEAREWSETIARFVEFRPNGAPSS